MRFFTPALGFDDIVRINVLDGVRVYFNNGDVAHIRPSGNAPQLRIYANSDSQARADEIVKLALREPDGILSLDALIVSSALENHAPIQRPSDLWCRNTRTGETVVLPRAGF
jgi:hypothetical protein